MQYESLRDIVLATIKSYCSYWGVEMPENISQFSDQELIDLANKEMYNLW
jgi:hypothetical protein